MLCCDRSSACSPQGLGLEPPGELGVGGAEGDGSSVGPALSAVRSDLGRANITGLSVSGEDRSGQRVE